MIHRNRVHLASSVRRAVAACFFTISVTSGSLVAQVPQASYPLLTDLVDTTGGYGDVTLSGSATGPANGVCVDGIYLFAGGSDAITPNISSLDTNDFQIEIEFQVAALQSFSSPIFIGGNGWRWIGFQNQSNGTFGLLHNNAISEWSSASVTVGTWHSAVIKYESGMVELFLDGTMVLQSNIGALNTGNNLNFTTNNFSNGTNFNGCIRNVVISNDTTLGSGVGPIGTNYCGPGNANSTGAPGQMSAAGTNIAADNNVTLTASSVSNNSFGFFLTSQMQGFTANPGGSVGNLCLGGAIGRYVGPGQIQNTGSSGAFSVVLDLTMTPTPTGLVTVQSGETWYFQGWHRDTAGGMATSNLTDGLEITFQ